MERLIVIGGDAAGMSAASQVKRIDTSFEIIVFEKGQFVSYAACGLPYFIANKEQKPEELLALNPEKIKRAKGIDVRWNSEVLNINIKEKKVLVKNKEDNSEEEYYFDKLLIATGASPIIPNIKGTDLGEVFVLRNLEDGIKLKEYIYTKNPKKAVIVGGGYIGLEMCEGFKKAGIEEIILIEKLPNIAYNYDDDIIKHIRNTLDSNGIKIYTGEEVKEIKKDNDKVIVITDKNNNIETDIILLTVGVKPNSEITKDTGIKLGVKNSIDVNNYMETNIKNVYAAGDCANIYDLVLKEKVYMPLGTNANKQGRIAGYNIAGKKYAIKGITGTNVFKVFDMEVGKTGLSEKQAKEKGFEVVSDVIKSKTKAGYYPGSKEIWVKLIADKKTKKLLGGEIVGKEGVAKRVDILSVALFNSMTIDNLRQLDLSYAPPFAPVWDPILVAANVLAKMF